VSAEHCELRLTRRFDASCTEVWAALTDPLSLERWLAGVIDVELSPGGNFELELRDDSRIAASVREVEAPVVLELDWSHAGEEPSIVRFELTEDGDGTLLVLDHRLIDERFGMAYISRWTAALKRLSVEIDR
jgi:uncharacterized protein YndB with AHSA1/START domain